MKAILQSLKVLAFRVTKKILNPKSVTSYGQGGEDLILERLFEGKAKTLFYVDVGSNDPIQRSNTYLLYLRGWSGLAIDGNPKLIKQHKSVRPRDIALCALISDTEEEKIFTIFEDTCVSSADENQVRRMKKTRKASREVKLKTETLDSIFTQQNIPQKFDLLSIDVEGNDYKALVGIDFAKYQPSVIVIEDHTFDINNPDSSDIHAFLTSKSYRLNSFARPNLFYELDD